MSDIPTPMLTLIQLKATAQALHNVFEEQRPGHEYTEMLGGIVRELQQLDDELTHTLKEYVTLRDRVEMLGDGVAEYEEHTEQVKQPDTISDEEWTGQTLITKTPF